MGSATSALETIPPLQNEFFYAGQCISECTEKAIPKEGVNIICGGLHTHLAGTKIALRHIRDGVEQKIPFEDNHYDFNYQIFRYLPEEITVLPGDELLTDCYYNTMDRTEPTFGGEATHEEMCLTFVRYYPRTAQGWSDCVSDPSFKNYFNALGIESVYLLPRKTNGLKGVPRSWIEEIVVKRPESLQNKTVGEVIRGIDWSDEKVSKDFSDALGYGEHDCYCHGNGMELMDSHSVENYYPHFEQYFKPEDDCSASSTSESSDGITTKPMFLTAILTSVLIVAL